MSTTQNSNNRGETTITKNAETKTVTITKTVQVITIEQGNKDGTLAFKVDTGYLYAASDGSNHLKTETSLDDNGNGSWKIQVDADGTATVTAQGTNSHNLLKYNSGSGLFSCYTGGQQDIQIYRYTGSGEIVYPEDPVGPGGGGDSGGGGTGGTAGAKWVLLTDVTQLNNGDKIIFVSPDKAKAAVATLNSGRLTSVDLAGAFSGDDILDSLLDARVAQFTASTSDKVTWEFTCSAGKLGVTSVDDTKKISFASSATTTWTLSASTQKKADHQVQIKSTKEKSSSTATAANVLQYSSSYFANYKNSTEDPLIYVYKAE